MPEPKKVNLWELTDLSTPWCVYVVATLRIAEHIAAGIDRIDDLARAAKLQPRGPSPGAWAPRDQRRV